MTEWIVSSCLLIAVILLTRRIFRSKLRPRVQYALWALVLLRLLVPFSFFQSSISPDGFVEEVKKQPAIQSVTDKLTTPNISYEQAYDQAVQDFLQSGQEFTPEQTMPDYTAPHYVPLTPLEQHTQEILDNSTPAVRLEAVLLWIWMGGMAVTGFCFLLSNLKFRMHLRKHRCPLPGHSAPLQVYICDGLDTPCLFGLFRPAVYLLPEEAADEAKAHHILTHELTHYCHGDHIWAILRCVCLVLHWYNPLVWLAAILSRRDAELACDEATVRKLGEDQRRAYGITLIEATCARTPGAGLINTATTMTGSKAAIKERVIRIAKKQKLSIPALIAVLLIAAIAVGCAFSGTEETKLPQLSAEKQASLQAYFDKIGLDYQFYSPETNEEGLRYYGSFYDENGKEYIALFQSYGAITADHKLFEDCNVPVQLNYGGQQLTHRAPFIIHFFHTSDYYDGDYYDSPFLTHQYNALEFVTPPSFVNKEFLSELVETHRKYEKQIYGSVAKIITTDDEEAAKKQAQAVFNMTTSGWMTSLLFNYGQYDGYCILSHSHGVSLTDQPTTIGGKEFPYYSNEVHLVAFKDGILYNVDQLYADGKFSDSALSQLAEKHREYYLGQQSDPQPTEPPNTEPTAPLIQEQGRRDLTDSELKQAKDAFRYTPSSEREDFPASALRRFFTSNYDSPADIELSSFIIGFPTAQLLTDEAEFTQLRQLPNFPYSNAASIAQCENKIYKVSRKDIDSALSKYAGITLAEANMRWESYIDPLLYLEAYDAFYYSYAGSSEAGGFSPTSGWIEGDTAVLYRDLGNQYQLLTLKQTDGSWKIASFQHFSITPEPIPIDLEGVIQTPTVMIAGKLYAYTGTSYYGELPTGYYQVGRVSAQDNDHLPVSEFQAAQLPIGAELYANPKNNGIDLYVTLSAHTIHKFQLAEASKPTPDEDPVVFFQDLLSNSYWHNCIAGHTFDTPEKASLYAIFSNGTPETAELTEDEQRFLREETSYTGDTAYQRIPAQTIDDVLMRYLGITLDASEKDGLNSFRYYGGTDVYFSFFNGTEALGPDFTVTEVTVADGCYQVLYNKHSAYRITLQLVDGAYRILSNIAI